MTEAHPSLPPAAGDDLERRVSALVGEARRRRERRLLLIEGRADDARSMALALADWLCPTAGRWIGDPAAAHRALRRRAQEGRPALSLLDHRDAVSLLGGEADLLIYDAFAGLDPDALGAASGTLRGGGLLLLLTPLLGDWPQLPDPAAARLGAEPVAGARSRFIARLARLLADADCVLRLSTSSSRSKPIRSPGQPPDDTEPARAERAGGGRPEPRTADQQQAVDAICRSARGRAGRPLVLTSDRGRGKSAALGLAAGRLVAEDRATVLVTAPRFAAAVTVFEHALGLLPEGARDRLCFLAPDALLQDRPAADLLLIDEAAGIPAPMLEALLRQYRRACLATTVHGYEGTGRGFEVRFRAVLDQCWPGWRQIELRTPIRWADGDPLEGLVDRTLLLDAEPTADAAAAESAADLVFRIVDRDRLAEDEALLRSLFGLLVLGHYKTRPSDLRLILDGPDIALFALMNNELPVATALVSTEGGLDAELADAVFAGRRRPRGHLLAQTLSAHGGLAEAPRLRYARIVRIAVHPAARRRGLGRSVVDGIASHYRKAGLDAIGASFGAEAGLLSFWRRCCLAPVHLGSRRNAASGAHAAVVLKGLSDAGNLLADRARERFARHLPLLLAGPFRRLGPEVTAELLASLPLTRRPPLDADERRELGAFAHAMRPLEASLAVLHRLALGRLGPAIRADRLSPAQVTVLIAAVLQLRDVQEAAALAGCSGRRELITLLRKSAALLLDHTPSEQTAMEWREDR
jgi:tRNA(Met) cytidine acetyltransferase